MKDSWEINCIACTHDLEDKLGLSQITPPHHGALAVCQMDLRETASYQPPRSTAVQSQICRFAQEAIISQLHLLYVSKQKIDLQQIEKSIRSASALLEFFLKNHGWNAQVHAAIFLPPSFMTRGLKTQEQKKPSDDHSSSKQPHDVTLLCIGWPHVYNYNFDLHELHPLLAQSISPRRGFGELYPFTLEVLSLSVASTARLLMGMPSWQQVRPSLVERLFCETWPSLSQLLQSQVNSNEIDYNPSFFVRIVAPSHSCWQKLSIWSSKALLKLRQSFSLANP